LTAGAAISFTLLKSQTFPAVSESAGVRRLWHEIEPQLADTCMGDVRRHVAYGLSYYSHGRLPDCSAQPRPWRVESDPPALVRAGPKR
jgi:hypothetical protein